MDNIVEEQLKKNMSISPENGEEFDIIVIGAGPAGMSTAMCARRGGLKTLLIEQALPGGHASTAYHIDNYLGSTTGVLGEDLGRTMEEQVSEYEHYYSCEMVEDIIEFKDNVKLIKTELNNEYRAKAIVIATGLQPKTLDADFEKVFGRGVSYYAQCDVDMYKDADVAVIGVEIVCYAAEFYQTNKLYLIHKSDHVKAVQKLREKILNNPKIHCLRNSDLSDIFGIDKVEKIKIKNTLSDQYT